METTRYESKLDTLIGPEAAREADEVASIDGAGLAQRVPQLRRFGWA